MAVTASGPLQLVWFKRDLRIADHKPLLEASRLGAVLPLYVVEPHYWQQSDCSGRQWQFCAESLLELRLSLARLGQPLVVRCGQVEQVLERAHRTGRPLPAEVRPFFATMADDPT